MGPVPAHTKRWGCRWAVPNCSAPEPWLSMADLVFVPGGDSDVVRHVVTPGQQGTKKPLPCSREGGVGGPAPWGGGLP